MLVYSGGYTTPYMLSSLQKLNDPVSRHRLLRHAERMGSVLDLDCKGGKGEIYAIPNDLGAYGLFYNKALFKKAGIAAPPKPTRNCSPNRQARRRASRSPTATVTATRPSRLGHPGLASYMAKGDVSKVDAGKMTPTRSS